MDSDSFALLIPIVAIGAPLATAIICRFVKMIEVASKQHYDSQIKLKMIERGYSADEIERVCQIPVKSKRGELNEASWAPIAPAKPAKL